MNHCCTPETYVIQYIPKLINPIYLNKKLIIKEKKIVQPWGRDILSYIFELFCRY